MRDPPGAPHQVEGPVADNRVGDAQIAALRVPRLGVHVRCCSAQPSVRGGGRTSRGAAETRGMATLRQGRGPSPRRRRGGRPLRWLAVAGIALVVFLYYRPLRSYLDKRAELARQTTEVRELRAERRELQRRLAASASTAALMREARRLGLVRPGEQLFIVKGVDRYRAARR